MGVRMRGDSGLVVRSQDVRAADRAILVPSRRDTMNLLKKNTEKIKKKKQ